MENQTKLKMRRLYSFINENCMCSAGISAYESLPENKGTFQDVYMGNKKKKHRQKKHRYFEIKSALKSK